MKLLPSFVQQAVMSAMGQERTLTALDFISALPPLTDIRTRNVRFGV